MWHRTLLSRQENGCKKRGNEQRSWNAERCVNTSYRREQRWYLCFILIFLEMCLHFVALAYFILMRCAHFQSQQSNVNSTCVYRDHLSDTCPCYWQSNLLSANALHIGLPLSVGNKVLLCN